MTVHKLVSLEALSSIINEARQAGRKTVFANGCFDLVHIGHIRYLKDAASYGDILIVAINSDQSVRRLKGKDRPVFSQQERAELLASIDCVDYIIIFEEDDVSRLLLSIKPDFHAKGTDYTENTVPERDIVASYGGKVIITGDKKTRSSRDLLKYYKNNR